MRYFILFTILFSFIFISCSDEVKKESCKVDTDCKDGKLCDIDTQKCKLFECEETANCYEFNKWSEDKDIVECIDKLCVEAPKCDTEVPTDCKDDQLCLFKEAQNNYFCTETCTDDTECTDGDSCENVENKDLKACFTPLYLNGKIINNDNQKAIEGAFVTLNKTDNTFISNTTQTDENGNYSIYIPILRDNKGKVVESQKDIFYKLRVSALNFQKYPSFIRVSIPFKLDNLTKSDDNKLIYSSILTTIYLFPLNQENLKMISGKLSEELAGALVVAENSDKTLSNFGYTDVKGNFHIVNLVSGDYKVVAYHQGYNFSKENITINDINVEDVLLNKLDLDLGVITGSVQIVNASGNLKTSIVIVPESTFNDNWRKGEFAPGLRAPEPGTIPNIDSNYEIKDIPEGDYVVLAAFENDGLVQDPDQNISGTQIVHFSIPQDNSYNLTIDSFKITEALTIVSPGANEIEKITTLTKFEWVDDSSEDGYIVELFDSFGNKIFDKTINEKNITSLVYDGAPLQKGYYYQWKVTSFRDKNGMSYISKSEDLKGIFFIE